MNFVPVDSWLYELLSMMVNFKLCDLIIWYPHTIVISIYLGTISTILQFNRLKCPTLLSGYDTKN